MNVDVRGKHRNDDGVRASGHFRHVLCQDRRWSIHYDVRGIGRYPHLPCTRHAAVALEGCNTVYKRLFGLALFQPATARALGIVVGQKRTVP